MSTSPKTKTLDLQNIKFRGGIDKVREKGLLPSGAFSEILNMRPRRPGLESRYGHTKHHTITAYPSKSIISLYQMDKSRRSEKKIFAQYDDGSVDQAEDNPPAQTTGNFGSSVKAAGAEPYPAVFSVLNDAVIMSDGESQHHINYGSSYPLLGFFEYTEWATIPRRIEEIGNDHTNKVSEFNAETFHLVNFSANNKYLYFVSQMPINKLNVVVSSGAATGDGTATIEYWNGSNFATVGAVVDTTKTTVLFGQTGSLSWTLPLDESVFYAFGIAGYVYRYKHNSTTGISNGYILSITCENTSGFIPIKNISDGELIECIEAKIQVGIEPNHTYKTYAGSSVTVGGMAGNDRILVRTTEPVQAFYIDIGNLKNTTQIGLAAVRYWDGSAWANITRYDQTGGFVDSGFIVVPNHTPQKRIIEGTLPSYWYVIAPNSGIETNIVFGIYYLPIFDINNISDTGQANNVWKERACYSFNDNLIHISKKYAPMVLNGSDYGIIGAGDGRANKVLAMKKYYNEMFVWQEEKGVDGGCLTIIEGDRPTNFDKLVLSTKVGIFNGNCVEVVEDVDISDISPDRPVFKGIFWLSREGLFMCEGRVLKNISGGIANYFDNTRPEAVRRGYEKYHFLKWDSSYRLFRIGLVTGSTATRPNVFLIYDPVDKVFMRDALAQPLSAIVEVAPESGGAAIMQYGGGQDGFLYRLNDTKNDDGVAINNLVVMEINGEGKRFYVDEDALRVKVQTVGSVTRDMSVDGNASVEKTTDLAMQEAVSGDTYRRHRNGVKIDCHHMSITWKNAVAGEGLYLLDASFTIRQIRNNL